MNRPVVLVEFAPSGGLFQFGVQLGEALAEVMPPVELWTGPEPELSSGQTGFAVRPLLPTWHPADTADRGRVMRRLRRPLRAGQLVLAWIVLGARLVAARPRSVVFSHWRFSFEPLFVAAFSRLLPHTTFAIVAHEPFPRSDARDTSTEKSGTLLQACFGAAWHRLDAAFVLGARTGQLVIERWNPPCDVVVIPHGDENALKKVAAPQLPVEGSAPAALFFGTWTRYKGIEDLLDAFALVREELPDARLIMAGAVGADVDLPRVLNHAKAIGNVEARPHYIASDQVGAVMSGARLVVVPYIRASQSGVVHLAYTFGRPVVATAVGDLPDVVRDGDTGFLVAARDRHALSQAMLTLLRDPELAHRMGETGRRSIEGAWAEAARLVADTLIRAESRR